MCVHVHECVRACVRACVRVCVCVCVCVCVLSNSLFPTASLVLFKSSSLFRTTQSLWTSYAQYEALSLVEALSERINIPSWAEMSWK